MFFKLKYVALAAVISTFFLLGLGNIVTVTGSGMGCGDHWPGCNGQLIPNFTHPAVVIEFSHRAVAGPIVSLLILIATIWAWCVKDKPYQTALRVVSSLTIGLLLLQVTLGAITVKHALPPHIIIMHLGVAMAFLSSLIVFMMVAYRQEGGRRKAEGGLWKAKGKTPISFKILVAFTTLLTYLQILLGAYVRHSGSALACPDIPLCQGQLLPPMGAALIHFSHRLGALLVALLVIGVVIQAYRTHQSADRKQLGRLAVLLVTGQIIFGILSVLSQLAVYWTTFHVMTGAALLSVMVGLTVKIWSSDPTNTPQENVSSPVQFLESLSPKKGALSS